MRRGEPRCGVNNKEMKGRINMVNNEENNAILTSNMLMFIGNCVCIIPNIDILLHTLE